MFVLNIVKTAWKHISQKIPVYVINPNPVEEKATFTYELFTTDMENVQLEIYDLNGLKLYNTRLTKANGVKQADVSFLKPTQYIVLIRGNEGILVQAYMIKK